MWIEHGAEVSNISLRKKCKIEKRILKNPLFLLIVGILWNYINFEII